MGPNPPAGRTPPAPSECRSVFHSPRRRNLPGARKGPRSSARTAQDDVACEVISPISEVSPGRRVDGGNLHGEAGTGRTGSRFTRRPGGSMRLFLLGEQSLGIALGRVDQAFPM